MVAELNEREMKYSIFVVVNLLNLSSKTLSDSEQRKQLALLNCQAGRRALDASAFDSAAEYAKQGIQLLPEDGWKVEYDLQLELYTIGAVSAGFIGEVETLEKYCSEVLRRKDIPTTMASLFGGKKKKQKSFPFFNPRLGKAVNDIRLLNEFVRVQIDKWKLQHTLVEQTIATNSSLTATMTSFARNMEMVV